MTDSTEQVPDQPQAPAAAAPAPAVAPQPDPQPVPTQQGQDGPMPFNAADWTPAAGFNPGETLGFENQKTGEWRRAMPTVTSADGVVGGGGDAPAVSSTSDDTATPATAAKPQVVEAGVPSPDGVMDKARDIARGAVSGIIHGVHETSASIDSVATAATKALKAAGIPDIEVGYDENGLHLKVDRDPTRDASAGQAVAPDTAMFDPETLPGRLSAGASQFITGMALFGKVSKAIGLGTRVGTELTKSTLSNAFSFDAHDPMLADMLKDYPSISNVVGPYLQSNPDDTEATARLKRGLEGLGLGGVTEGLFGAIRAYRLGKAGKLQEAAQASDEASAATDAHNASTERVASAALQHDGKVFTGVDHGEAFDKATAAGYSADDVANANKDGGGFVTSTGRYVSREEALSIAKKRGQIAKGQNPDKELASEDLAPEKDHDPDETGQGATPMIPADAGNGRTWDPRLSALRGKPAPIEAGPVDVDRYREKLARNEDWVTDGGQLPDDVPLRYQGNLDVGNAINTLQEAIGQSFVGAQDGVRSLKEVRTRADAIARTAGIDRAQLLAWAQQDARDIQGLDSRITAYNDLYVSQASRVTKLADALTEGRPGEFDTMDQLYSEFGKQLHDLNQIRSSVKTISSEAARTMGAQRGMNALKVTEDYDGIGLNKDDLLRIANSIKLGDPKDAESLTKLLQPTLVGRAVDFANSWLVNSVLSMGTVGVKASTDLAQLAITPVEKMVSGALRLDPAAIKAGAGMYASYGRFLFDSFGMAGRAFKLGGQISDPAHGYVLPEGLGDGTIFHNLANGNQGAALVNSLVRYATLPVRVIGTNDEFTKSLMYRAEVTRRAVMDGRDSTQALADAFDANGHPTDMTSWLEAQKSAMAQAPIRGSDNVWMGSKSLTAGAMDFANSVPIVRQVQPFIKVIGNLGRYGWRHTPGINLLQREYFNDITAGGEKGSDAMAQMTTGAAMWATGVYLANAGMITGTLHPDPIVQKQIEELTGERHSSLVLTNPDGTKEYIPLAQISDPIGPMMAAAADFAKVSHYLTDGDLASFGVGAAATLGNALKDKNYLKGFTDFTEAASGLSSGNDSAAARWRRYAAQRLGSMMVPSMFANKRGDDPYMREIRTYLDGPLSKLPGSINVDPRRNVLGEPVPVTAAIGPKDLSPFQRSHDDMDPVNQELGRQLGMGDKPLPLLPKTLQLANGHSQDLTQIPGPNGFTAYDHLQELMATPPSGRPSLRQALTDLFNDPRYAQASEGVGQYGGSKRYMIDKTIGEYHTMASKALLGEAKASPNSPFGQVVTSAIGDAENKQAALRGVPLPHPELVKRNAFKEAVQPQ